MLIKIQNRSDAFPRKFDPKSNSAGGWLYMANIIILYAKWWGQCVTLLSLGQRLQHKGRVMSNITTQLPPITTNFKLNFCYYCDPPGGLGPHFGNELMISFCKCFTQSDHPILMSVFERTNIMRANTPRGFTIGLRHFSCQNKNKNKISFRGKIKLSKRYHPWRQKLPPASAHCKISKSSSWRNNRGACTVPTHEYRQLLCVQNINMNV